MSPLDSFKMTGSGLLTPMPMTIPRGSLTTQIVTPPAWLTTMSWRNGWLSISQRQTTSMPLSSSRIRGHWTKLEPGSTPRGSGNTASVAKGLTRNAGWRGLFVPLTSETGLAEVQCTWGGVFVAEAIAALRPTWHLLPSDTDVAPTALFEVNELVDLCRHLMHEELSFGEPGILIGTNLIRISTLAWPSSLAHKPPRGRVPFGAKSLQHDVRSWRNHAKSFHTGRLHSCPRSGDTH